MMTLFHPATGKVRVKGTTNCPNTVLHPWLKQSLTQILETMPERHLEGLNGAERRAEWERWQKGLTQQLVLPNDLPPLRMLLILDNLQGHKSASLVNWLLQNGIMPLYTPVGGSWLNMAESIQGILGKRALAGQHPRDAGDIIEWLEATARGWNNQPTVFHWGGKRAMRRSQTRMRRQLLAGSEAYINRKLTRCSRGNTQRK